MTGMARRKILVVTGSRADYGLLYWPMKLLQESPDFELQVVATGMHLSAEFGDTYRQIEQDGFALAGRIDMLLSSDSPTAVAKSVGLGLIGFADLYDRLQPDLLVALGDRFEILAAAQAAFIKHIPIAHLYGGDVTEGSLDDVFRHTITKMSGLHFVSNAQSGKRVRQLGEDPARIHEIGSTGVDNLKRSEVLSRQQLAEALGHPLASRYLLVTFHPITLHAISSVDQAQMLLRALDKIAPETGIVFTLGNADAEGRQINALIGDFVRKRPGSHAHTSLGSRRYINLMRHATAVVGNSSSGLYEAPSLSIPTVNIGNRQEGRLRAASVIDCAMDEAAISAAIAKALSTQVIGDDNPYGDGQASVRLVETLRGIADFKSLNYKRFLDL
jgi:UDP-N-acetylglucosamine 2-epimerase (non-hydrolysing)/GDP/UDP-N,N'-diacetylbacillosamine 2-epimerase (hydrolysing)